MRPSGWKTANFSDVRELRLRGRHNYRKRNGRGSHGRARLAPSLPEIAQAAGVLSPAVEHRLEFVREIDGVAYYNDSKATNVDATLKAIDAFPGGLWIILGGKDKDSDYTVLREPLRAKARAALLIGAAAHKIASQLAATIRARVANAERWRRPCSRLTARPSPATPCCSRRPAPASTSSKISNIAAGSSRNW